MSEETESQENKTTTESFRQNITESSGGEDASAFLKNLDEDLRQNKSLQNVKDVNDLAKQFVNSQKLIGQKYMPEPDTDSDDELRNYYKQIGMPEDPKEYGIEVSDELKEMGFDEERFKKMAHEAGLTKKQAEKLFNNYSQSLTEDVNSKKQEHEQRNKERDEEFLKMAHDTYGEEEWGKVTAEVQQFINKNVPEDVRKEIAELDNKSLFTIIHPIKKALDTMNEEGQPISKSDTDASSTSENPIDIKNEMTKIYNDPEYRRDPRLQAKYDALVKKLMKIEGR